MMDEVMELLKELMSIAPEMAPKVERAVEKWGQLHKIPTNEYIHMIRANRFDAIDKKIDDEVDSLDIPD